MHGIVHVEIPVTNLKQAQNWYGKVFGWPFMDSTDPLPALHRLWKGLCALESTRWRHRRRAVPGEEDADEGQCPSVHRG